MFLPLLVEVGPEASIDDQQAKNRKLPSEEEWDQNLPYCVPGVIKGSRKKDYGKETGIKYWLITWGDTEWIQKSMWFLSSHSMGISKSGVRWFQSLEACALDPCAYRLLLMGLPSLQVLYDFGRMCQPSVLQLFFMGLWQCQSWTEILPENTCVCTCQVWGNTPTGGSPYSNLYLKVLETQCKYLFWLAMHCLVIQSFLGSIIFATIWGRDYR